jgi:hypothetical protein
MASIFPVEHLWQSKKDCLAVTPGIPSLELQVGEGLCLTASTDTLGPHTRGVWSKLLRVEIITNACTPVLRNVIQHVILKCCCPERVYELSRQSPEIRPGNCGSRVCVARELHAVLKASRASRSQSSMRCDIGMPITPSRLKAERTRHTVSIVSPR